MSMLSQHAAVSVSPSHLPEGEAAPAEGQRVVPRRLSLLVVGLVSSQLVARLTVAQVGFSVLSKVAVYNDGREGQEAALLPSHTSSWFGHSRE